LPCEECPSCRKIEGGNSIDVHVLSCPAGETIKIEDIREFIAQVQLRPFEAQKKIFIIKNAENLTPPAGNALLKTLEEPSATSLIILTTSAPSNVLGTIQSRCQPIHFFPASRGKLANFLQKDYDIADEKALFLSAYSEGCLGQARQLQEKDFLARKNEIINEMVFSPLNNEYLKKILADKEQVREVLFVLWSWFRDVLLLKQGLSPEDVIHVDRKGDLQKISDNFTDDELSAVLDQIVKAIQLLNDNLNIKIALILLKEQIWVRPLR
jgi:DNA polymerase-3 subunit delta'